MKPYKIALLLVSHGLVAALGFAGGIYALPILTAPPAPTALSVNQVSATSIYQAQFIRDLQDSDLLHWGDGTVSLGPEQVSFMGELSPGPDFKLYLSPTFVETEADFERLKSEMIQVGDVRTFENFIVPLSADINLADYTTVIVWCESFGQFITAAKYR